VEKRASQVSRVGIHRAEPRAVRVPWARSRALLTSACNSPAVQPLTDFVDRAAARCRRDWRGRPGRGLPGPAPPWAFLREGMPRARQHAPAGRGKADHGGRAQCRGLAPVRSIVRRGAFGGAGHAGSFEAFDVRDRGRVLDQNLVRARRGRNSIRSCRRNGRSCQNSNRAGRDAPAAPGPGGARHLADDVSRGKPWRSPVRRRSGFRGLAIACWPRRRSAPASAGVAK